MRTGSREEWQTRTSLCCVAVIVLQQSTKALIAFDVAVSEPDFTTGSMSLLPSP